MFYTFQRILVEFLLPPFSPFILMLCAFWFVQKRPRMGWAVAILATGLFLVASMEGLQQGHTPQQPEPLPVAVHPPYPAAEAIVVLGGGRYLNAREYGGDTAGPSTLERVRYAAKLFRETSKPILVTGGKPAGLGVLAEGDIMHAILEQEFKVPVQWVENQAQETKTNAEYSGKILLPLGITRIYLVTHGAHMARAVAEFQNAGFEPVPMITGFVGPEPRNLFFWVPSFQGLAASRATLYEYLARIKPF